MTEHKHTLFIQEFQRDEYHEALEQEVAKLKSQLTAYQDVAYAAVMLINNEAVPQLRKKLKEALSQLQLPEEKQ